MEALIRTPLGIFPPNAAREALRAAGLPLEEANFQRLIVPIDLWGPSAEKPGYLSRIRQSTIGEVLVGLQEYLPLYIPDYKEMSEGMSYSWWGDKKMNKDDAFPASHWISCYLVTGGSEGHYIHVDTIDKDGNRQLIYLEKTFSGSVYGWRIVEAIAAILEA